MWRILSSLTLLSFFFSLLSGCSILDRRKIETERRRAELKAMQAEAFLVSACTVVVLNGVPCIVMLRGLPTEIKREPDNKGTVSLPPLPLLP